MTPARAGTEWTKEEEARLVRMFDARYTIEDMMEAHQRTADAIISRLALLGRLREIGKAYHRVAADPFITFDQLKGLK